MRKKWLLLSLLGLSAFSLSACQNNPVIDPTSEEEISEKTSEIPSESETSESSNNEAAYTIMIYMCGSDLESDTELGGLATLNINEILSVDLNDEVNVIIETGGSKRWYTPGINASYLQRFHVENKKLIEDEKLTKANMGSSETFQSFVEWGLNEYPAEKTGVILWNHGGAMSGVCFDENYHDDSLTNSEIKTALNNAFKNTKRNEKLEWIGYDACLMAVLDIADFNSDFFNYMVCSQESEPGEGWAYSKFLKTLSNNPSINTETLLGNIVDSYVTKCGDMYNEIAEDPEYADYKNYNDATLSVLDLSKVSSLVEAWENVSTSLSSIITSSRKFSTFKSNILNKAQRFGYDPDYGYSFDIFDLEDVVNLMKNNSTYNVNGLNEVKTAYQNVIINHQNGRDSGDACGLCIFAAASGYSFSSDYSTSETNLTNWRTLNSNYGSWYR